MTVLAIPLKILSGMFKILGFVVSVFMIPFKLLAGVFNAIGSAVKFLLSPFAKIKGMFSSLGKAIQEGVTDKFLMLKDIFLAIPKAFKKMGGMLFGGVGWLAGKLGIPGFQDGGTTPGGPVVVGEQGPEIVAPPAGSGVLPNFLTTALADVGNTMGGMLGIGGGGGAPQEINLHVTLELEGRELAKYIKKVALPMMNPVAGKST